MVNVNNVKSCYISNVSVVKIKLRILNVIKYHIVMIVVKNNLIVDIIVIEYVIIKKNVWN